MYASASLRRDCAPVGPALQWHTVEQRFLHRPSRWSAGSCLVSVLDMGPMALAQSADIPGLDQRLQALFAASPACAGQAASSLFLAELLAHLTLELQCRAGVPCARRAIMTVHERRGQVRIIIASNAEALTIRAFALACAMVAALCAGRPVDMSASMAALLDARTGLAARS
ncbi:MAG: hypothetical protein ACJ8GW_18810 [Massilia sp.]